VTLRPPQVHPHEHLRPVRGVGPADARAHREDRVALVVWTGELRLERRLRDLVGQGEELALEIGSDRRVLVERRKLGEVCGAPLERLPALELLAEQRDTLEQALGVIAVVPDVGTRGLFV
jgi:hypothetical protein